MVSTPASVQEAYDAFTHAFQELVAAREYMNEANFFNNAFSKELKDIVPILASAGREVYARAGQKVARTYQSYLALRGASS
jgi:hypothetical protein